jgi:hypothetical protein
LKLDSTAMIAGSIDRFPPSADATPPDQAVIGSGATR